MLLQAMGAKNRIDPMNENSKMSSRTHFKIKKCPSKK